MNRTLIILCVGALLGGSTLFAAKDKPAREKPARTATPTSKPSTTVAPANVGTATYDAFRLIPDRNIFSSYRTGRPERTEEQQPRSEYIALVGTMDSDKGTFAFFDGSDAAYRKALRAGDAVGGFKIASINANAVELERDGKKTAVRVAQQLRKPEGGEWRLIADAPRIETPSSSAAPAAAPEIPGNASETLRRLMEQRQKQLKQ